MIKDYYIILGLSRNTSAEEIKKSYRKLALKYHPDKNSDQNSKNMILEINEAYEVLGDPHKREVYNLKYDYRQAQPVQPPRPATSGNYNPIKKRSPRKPVKSNRINYADYATKGRIVSLYIVFYCFMLSLDYCISSVYKNAVVQNVDVYVQRSKKAIDFYVYSIETSRIDVTAHSSNGIIQTGDVLEIDVTPIFGIVKTIKNASNGIHLDIFNIFMPFYFMVLIGMGTAVTALLVKSQEHSFSFSIFSSLTFILIIYFTYKL